MLWPRTSPDRKKVAYLWNPGGGKTVVQVVRLADGAVVTVSHALVTPVGWSADSRTLFLSGGRFLADTYEVLAVPATGGKTTILGTFPPDVELLDVTPDGQSAILNRHEGRSDAWLIQFSAARRD